jgi:signal transduction histidine kinase
MGQEYSQKPWDSDESKAEARKRLRWLSQLRWAAMAGALLAAMVAWIAEWQFVSSPMLVAGVLAGVAVNALLLFRLRWRQDLPDFELSLHALADIGALTWLLFWAGGLANPLSSTFCFHVVLGALLSGRRGAWTATLASAVAVIFLAVAQWKGLLPLGPLEHPPALLWVVALGLLMGGLLYFSLILSERLKSEHVAAIEQGQAAQVNLRLLMDALGALKVGLEVVEPNGQLVMSNDFAQSLRANLAKDPGAELKPTSDNPSWVCPGSGGRCRTGPALCPENLRGKQLPPRPRGCRFAVSQGERERLIDMVSLEADALFSHRAFLYVDKTDALLVESRQVMLERLATLGRALQGVAHELNTPLMTMQTLAKDLVKALADEKGLPAELKADLDESLELMVEEARRCRSLTQGLLSTAHADAQGKNDGRNLQEIVHRAIRLLGQSPHAAEGPIQIRSSLLSQVVPTEGDRVLQIVLNLLQNALQAADEGSSKGSGRVEIACRPQGEHALVEIRDNGPGLPANVRDRLFEPFVTTKENGTGLGLYTSYMLAKELGGDLSIADHAQGGTLASLVLPLAPGHVGLTEGPPVPEQGEAA